MSEPTETPIWTPGPGATQDAIDALRRAAPIELPSAYLEQLRRSNGGEGDLAVEPGWIVFWPAEEVIENNQGYEVEQWVPGLFGFGSNGGGELLAFDTREGQPFPIVMVPFIPMELEEAVVIAKDFAELLRHLGRSADAGPGRRLA